MVEDHYRLKRLEMALAATRFLLKSTRICDENMPKTTRLATLYMRIGYKSLYKSRYKRPPLPPWVRSLSLESGYEDRVQMGHRFEVKNTMREPNPTDGERDSCM